MEIISENQASRLEIEVTATEVIYYPSMRLSVSVVDEGFTGCGEVWVSTDDWKKFVADLQLCERVRQGQAALLSISPGELKLTFEQADGWGHFILRYTLGRTSYASYGTRVALDKSVLGGFDLDSSTFRELVADFSNLLKSVE